MGVLFVILTKNLSTHPIWFPDPLERDITQTFIFSMRFTPDPNKMRLVTRVIWINGCRHLNKTC
jgi:Tfp pilus assembly protein PilZ